MWVGCGTKQNKQDALNWWLSLTDESHPAYIREVSPRIRARAFACLADYHWETRIVDGVTWNIDSVYRAALSADSCIAYGLVTPNTLWIGNKTRELLSQPFQAGKNNSRFGRLDSLWDALDTRQKEMEAEDDKRRKKVSKAPNMYMCAAQGCGIQATKKSGLSRCAGSCPQELKPGYCSKSCQRAVCIDFCRKIYHDVWLICTTGLETSQNCLQARRKTFCI